MYRQTSTRAAMTAIEVLAATVLASLMLGSVVGVLTGLTRQQKIVLKKDDRPAWTRQLAAQLEWDLRNSRWMTSSVQGLRLEGFAARDFLTGRPTGRPSIVEYCIRSNGPKPLLLRREMHADDTSGDKFREELLLVGVDRFVVGGTTVKAAGAVVVPAKNLEPVAIPGQLMIELHGPNHAIPLFAQQIHVR